MKYNMLDNENQLFIKSFPETTTKSVSQIPFFIQDYEFNRKQVYSSAISFNCEFLILGHYNCFSLIDLVTHEHTIQYTNLTEKQSINTSCCIGYYNHFIAFGTQEGDCCIFPLLNTPRKLEKTSKIVLGNYLPNTIKSIHSTNGDLLIMVSISTVKIARYENISMETPFREELQPLGISHSIYDHCSNQLILALGDCSIKIFICQSFELLLQKCIQYYLEPLEIINRLNISEDGRLLAVAQCQLFEGNQYRIDIIDLKRKGKIIKKYSYTDGNEVTFLQFMPLQNAIFIGINTQSGYVLQFDQDTENERILNYVCTDQVKEAYPLSKTTQYANMLIINSNGEVNMIVFEAPKKNYLLQMPFMYFVELKLSEQLDYKPLMQQYFQSTYYAGFSGIDKKNLVQQQIVVNGEQYFEPLFDSVMRFSEFKEYYKQQYSEKIRLKKKKYQFPLWLASWALKRAYEKQDSKLENIKPKQESRKSKKQKVPTKMNFLMETQPEDVQNKETIEMLGVNCDIFMQQQEDLNVIDERYMVIYKLIVNMQYQNITMLLLGNCHILFNDQFNFKDLLIQIINKMDRLSYLDLSNNYLKLSNVKLITRLTQLKYLDLSNNKLGNSEKRPLQKMKMKQTKIHITDTIDESSFYDELFNKIQMINLRNNDYNDDEGAEFVQKLKFNDQLRLLDISGNPQFSIKTRDELYELIENSDKIKTSTVSQILIIEFNQLISESTMKYTTNILIEKYTILKKATVKLIEGQLQSSQMQFYVYVVNSNQNYDWEQSLLQLYEKQEEGQEDEIRSCLFKFIGVYITLFVDQFNNFKDNFIPCLTQCFCTIFFFQKYVICCYCVFLQSDYGSWITHLLGIKTADYEYNNKKDDLKKSLENQKYFLNIIFWINFLVFYTICIFIPIYFVLQCQGHAWTGHFIYAGYSVCIFFFELYLAITCMKFNITHAEFSEGPYWKRIMFLSKDLILSQVAKFDVYSDVCFITTVMTCDVNIFIGYIAILIMVISLGTTAYHVISLLCSRQGGDENYIDYLCNYCSFVEIHLVSSLLEKWTIQNTSNFLCFKGLPNRVYAATFRTFAEDIPQFSLQVIYLLINPNSSGIEILMLSLASSTISTIISITKSITITKANRINDKIMMNEVKNKLKLTKQIINPQFNDQIIIFLHDYYDVFDGESEEQTLNYGKIDNKLAKYKQINIDYRNIKGQKQQKFQLRGLTFLEESNKNVQKKMTKKQTNSNEQIDEMFEPYLFLLNSQQAKIIQKLWSMQEIKSPDIAQILLELEICDFTDGKIMNSENQHFDFEEGSFIEALIIQNKILEQVQNRLNSALFEQLKILDLGCGYCYTATAILRLCERLKPKSTYSIVCVDHIKQILDKATAILQFGFEDIINLNQIKFIEKDCRDDLRELGTFDIIHVGFALQNTKILQTMLNQQGLAIYPQLILPQEHQYQTLIRDGTLYNEVSLNIIGQSGIRIAKELQYPDCYQYIEIQRGLTCSICQTQLESRQFYSPWIGTYFCIDCGTVDDSNEDPTTFKIQSNLVFIPKNASDEEMKRVSSYKFGRNLFPASKSQPNKYHPIKCNPCQREIGEEQEFDPQPRYICLNCRPGKFDGHHMDLCHDCAKSFYKEEEGGNQSRILYYNPGHKEGHLLLKIHFYHGYNEY